MGVQPDLFGFNVSLWDLKSLAFRRPLPVRRTELGRSGVTPRNGKNRTLSRGRDRKSRSGPRLQLGVACTDCEKH
jgi:hypothetical protein